MTSSGATISRIWRPAWRRPAGSGRELRGGSAPRSRRRCRHRRRPRRRGGSRPRRRRHGRADHLLALGLQCSIATAPRQIRNVASSAGRAKRSHVSAARNGHARRVRAGGCLGSCPRAQKRRGKRNPPPAWTKLRNYGVVVRGAAVQSRFESHSIRHFHRGFVHAFLPDASCKPICHPGSRLERRSSARKAYSLQWLASPARVRPRMSATSRDSVRRHANPFESAILPRSRALRLEHPPRSEGREQPCGQLRVGPVEGQQRPPRRGRSPRRPGG